jgi:hypothetical protein
MIQNRRHNSNRHPGNTHPSRRRFHHLRPADQSPNRLRTDRHRGRRRSSSC